MFEIILSAKLFPASRTLFAILVAAGINLPTQNVFHLLLELSFLADIFSGALSVNRVDFNSASDRFCRTCCGGLFTFRAATNEVVGIPNSSTGPSKLSGDEHIKLFQYAAGFDLEHEIRLCCKS